MHAYPLHRADIALAYPAEYDGNVVSAVLPEKLTAFGSRRYMFRCEKLMAETVRRV